MAGPLPPPCLNGKAIKKEHSVWLPLQTRIFFCLKAEDGSVAQMEIREAFDINKLDAQARSIMAG